MNPNKPNRAFLIAWIIIMAAGAVLLFTGITHESLWYDESYSAAIVNHSMADIVNITGKDSHPPLYYLGLRLFRLIFGNSVFSLRTLSILGAIALAAWGIGPVRRALGNRVGMIYSILVFAMPITISMAQEVRMYTWAAFFVTGSALYAYLAEKEGKLRDWVLFGLCSLGAAYTHYYALLAVIVIFYLMFKLLKIHKKKFLPILYVGGALIVAYIPWLIKLAGQMKRVSGSYWIPDITWPVLKNIFTYPFSNKFSLPAYPSLVGIAFLAAAALMLWGIVSRFIRRDEDVKMALMAFLGYILTIGGGLAASFLIRPVLVERYTIPVLGLFIISLSYGIAKLSKKVIVPVIVSALILAFSALQIQKTVTKRFNGPMTEAVNYLAPQIEPGDVFLHTDEHTLGTFSYYFPNNKHYYYQREGYGGYSNYDAFKPNGVMIKSLDEIGRDHRVWLIQRFGSFDTVSAAGWLGTGMLDMKGTPKVFQMPPSWYGFIVYKTDVSEPGSANEAVSGEVGKGSGNLTVRFIGFKNDKGTLSAGLYKKDQPLDGDPYKDIEAKINGGYTEIVFEDVPYGEYAITAIHDENNNQQFDFANGIPSEGLGYSGSVPMFNGPPEYDDCKFIFNSNRTSIDIVINYFQ